MRNIIYILFIVGFYACSPLEEPPKSLVVEAYIYENKPIENIKITLVNPINSELNEEPVSGAEVRIFVDNIEYLLTGSITPGFYHLESDLKIEPGLNYTLKVNYEDIEMIGTTIIPNKVENLTLNFDTLNLSLPDQGIGVTWKNNTEDWYLSVVSLNNADSTDFPFNNFFSLPTQGNRIIITPNNVQNEGKQAFILYGITPEYQDLYRISSSSIGSSNAGNMTNGFGIFAGFSSDTLNFVAIKK